MRARYLLDVYNGAVRSELQHFFMSLRTVPYVCPERVHGHMTLEKISRVYNREKLPSPFFNNPEAQSSYSDENSNYLTSITKHMQFHINQASLSNFSTLN